MNDTLDSMLKASAGLVVVEVKKAAAEAAGAIQAARAKYEVSIAHVEAQLIREIGAASRQGIEGIRAETERAAAANVGPVRLHARMGAMLSAVVLVGLGAVGGYVFRGQPTSPALRAAQLDALEARISADYAVAAVAHAPGGRIRWFHCGDRLCFPVAADQGEYDGRRIQLGGWTSPAGRSLVIPQGY